MYDLPIDHVLRLLRRMYGPDIQDFPSAQRVMNAIENLRGSGEFGAEVGIDYLIDIILRSMGLVETHEGQNWPGLDVRKKIQDVAWERNDTSAPLNVAFFSFPQELLKDVTAEVAGRLGLGAFRSISRNAKEVTLVSELMVCRDGLKQRVVLDASRGGSPQISAQLVIGTNDSDSISFGARDCLLRGPWHPAGRNQTADRESLAQSVLEPLKLAALSCEIA